MVEPEGIHSSACSYSHAVFRGLLLSVLVHAPGEPGEEGRGHCRM